MENHQFIHFYWVNSLQIFNSHVSSPEVTTHWGIYGEDAFAFFLRQHIQGSASWTWEAMWNSQAQLWRCSSKESVNIFHDIPLPNGGTENCSLIPHIPLKNMVNIWWDQNGDRMEYLNMYYGEHNIQWDIWWDWSKSLWRCKWSVFFSYVHTRAIHCYSHGHLLVKTC